MENQKTLFGYKVGDKLIDEIGRAWEIKEFTKDNEAFVERPGGHFGWVNAIDLDRLQRRETNAIHVLWKYQDAGARHGK